MGRKCCCPVRKYFGFLPNFQREKLLRHAKYGRPGVKTEYNESYRSWTEAKSKWDYFAVSAYSQKELDRMAKIEKKPPAGWPCRQFNFIGEDDGSETRPMDPYSDEWFDNYDIASALKVKSMKLQQRPKKQSSQASMKPRETESDISRTSSNTKFRKKMVKVQNEIYQAKKEESDQQSKTTKSCAKRKNAWVNDEPNYKADSEKNSRQPSRISSAVSSQSRAGKKQTSAVRRPSTAVPRHKSAVQKQKSTVQRPKSAVQRQRSDVTSEVGSDEIKFGDLYDAVQNLKNNIKQHKSLDALHAGSGSQHDIREVRSESVISFQSTQTESSRPASARSTYEEQLAKGDMAMKKFTFSGNPEKKDQMIYKHLAPTDKMMLKKRFDGLVEPYLREYVNDAKSEEEKDKRLLQEAKRVMKYPCSRGRNQDWKTNTLNTYEQWDENENKRQPNYIMDNDIFNIRAREHVKIVTPQHNERGEEKRDNIPKQEKKVEVKGHAYGDEKPTTRKWSTTEAFTSEERDKLIARNNKILDKQAKSENVKDRRWRSYQEYNNWNAPLPQKPAWAEKTYKSLGSGHWNLPLNKNEKWKKKQKLTAAEKNALKVENRKCWKDKNVEEQDPFLAMYYPDLRTNSTYLSQYVREYYRKPLQ